MMPYHLNRVVASNISSTILNQELNAKLKESEIGGNLTSTQVFELGDESLKYYRGILWRVGLQKNRGSSVKMLGMLPPLALWVLTLFAFSSGPQRALIKILHVNSHVASLVLSINLWLVLDLIS